MLRAGVIGVGSMGRNHARVYATTRVGCTLVGVYDADHARARAVADEFGVGVYPSPEALLGDADVVSIATPTPCHVEQTLMAARRGVAVLVEKPLAPGVAEAEGLARALDALPGRPIVQVGHIEHHNPAVRELRDVVDGQELLALEIHRVGPYEPRVRHIDVVLDLMLHDVHVVLSLAGSPLVSAQAEGRSIHDGVHLDYAVANLVFADGLIATLTASRIGGERVRRLMITGREAQIDLDYVERTITTTRSRSFHAVTRAGAGGYRHQTQVERLVLPLEEPLAAEIRSFLVAVETGVPPEVGVEAGVRCLQVIEAVKASIATGARIPLALAEAA
ncbi:MAG: Gfo/Idh/MocA family oxidoreductase [Thermoleophilia bacterium]|jgi:predicted dehydrogenase|nr:Gfo/Idh/MocA family oxidoreductase [Thermoleophilia bacterium]